MKYRKPQLNQFYNKTENTDYINTHHRVQKYPLDNLMELLWLQGKLQWAASVNNWTQRHGGRAKKPSTKKKKFFLNLKKSSEKPNTKTLEQYDYIHDIKQRVSRRVLILIRKNTLQNNINTHLQVISTTLHETISICSLYIPPHDFIFDKTSP